MCSRTTRGTDQAARGVRVRASVYWVTCALFGERPGGGGIFSGLIFVVVNRRRFGFAGQAAQSIMANRLPLSECFIWSSYVGGHLTNNLNIRDRHTNWPYMHLNVMGRM